LIPSGEKVSQPTILLQTYTERSNRYGAVITTKVKALLAKDDFLKSFQISVETSYKGVVQLSGFVNSQRAVDKAGQIARSVQEVNSVKNDLIVK